jgi:hypothetical protein
LRTVGEEPGGEGGLGARRKEKGGEDPDQRRGRRRLRFVRVSSRPSFGPCSPSTLARNRLLAKAPLGDTIDPLPTSVPTSAEHQSATQCLMASLAVKGNERDKAAEYYLEALRLNPFCWEAFEGLCNLGQSSFAFASLPTSGSHLSDLFTSPQSSVRSSPSTHDGPLNRPFNPPFSDLPSSSPPA